MARLSTETLSLDGAVKKELYFKYDINVNKDGSFSTTLPKEIVEFFLAAGIKTGVNMLSNRGYFTDKTFDGLKEQIKNVGLEYLSKEMQEEKIVIRYVIQTMASYSKNYLGEIAPNATEEWTKMENVGEGYNLTSRWYNGNVPVNATHTSPFGFLIYAQPFVKRTYKYRSGKLYIEYTRMCYGGEIAEQKLKRGYYLRWLDGIPCIAPPKNNDAIEELDYDETTAEFFVGMIVSICTLNERIKDFLKPDQIKKIIESKTKLLG